MVDVRALPTTDGDVIDLTAIDPYKTWIMAGDPGSLIKHPLVLSNDPFQRARMIYENDIEEWITCRRSCLHPERIHELCL